VKFCVEYAGCEIENLDAIAFYDKPLLKFERLLETYFAFAPRGLVSFVTSMPIWIREKLFLKTILRDELAGDRRKTMRQASLVVSGTSLSPRRERVLSITVRRGGDPHCGWRR
jgi:predicted NodU family carbamoyl transferase